MLGKVLVSVIIPTYNRATLLPGAIQSVIDQSIPSMEIIVVNDGSTDDTGEVIEPFLQHICYLESDNGGPAHARNVGMRAAKGQYIAFLDSDDLYLPGKLELQLAFMDAHPEVGLVSTEASAFNTSGIFEEYHLKTYHAGIYQRKGFTYENIYPKSGIFMCEETKRQVPYYLGNVFKYAMVGTFIFSPTALFRSEILGKVGYQNERYLYAQEYEFVTRICKFYQVAFLNVPTYLIRYHESQHSMADKILQQRTARYRALVQKKASIRLEVEKNILQTVLDWGVNDRDYYEENRSWLNHRLAEIFYNIGERYLELRKPKQARENFRMGYSYDPSWNHNMQGWKWSFCPHFIRRALNATYHKVLKKTSFDFYT